ncbi:MAG TPA: hypothetical protein VK686_04775 [Bryobacteraceae bacterium]|nr:hypothetical protein [Bryobacteraceae bacterium]
MPRGSQVTCVWPEPPFGLHAEDCVEGIQNWQDARVVRGIAKMYDVNVEDINRSAL